MAIKIGNNAPKAIMFADITTPKSDILFDTDNYYKYSSDGNGYYVHGLWLAPYGPWGVYFWPWDLSVASGALKDINNGSNKWGYVQDGVHKNITSNMNTSFPANVSGSQRICISLWGNTPNYTDSEGNSFLDFGDIPIIITFLDDRFDDYTWVGNTGAVYEWSEDKRTITIYRVPASKDLGHSSWICRSDISDVTIEKVRADLLDCYANVTGLTAHYNGTVYTDPSTIECWKAHLGDNIIYNKDKTIENCWKRYGFITESIKEESYNNATEEDPVIAHKITTRSITNNTSYSSVKLPALSDFESEMNQYNNHSLVDRRRKSEYITWNINIANPILWESVRKWYETHPSIYLNNLFENSNIYGHITLNLPDRDYDTMFSAHSCFTNTKVTSVTINQNSQHSFLTSGNTLFKNANLLEQVIYKDYSGSYTNAWSVVDTSGMFEFCHNLKELPENLYYYANLGVDYGDPYPSLITNFFVEYCYKLTTIPCVTGNSISTRHAEQMFFQCTNLVSIQPVIDCMVLDPRYAINMFTGCDKLSYVKLKNLNHGDWIFDGTARNITIGGETTENMLHGNLVLLDAECVQYLFDNLVDLSTHDNSTPTDADIVTKHPKSATANLYCPAAWFSGATGFFDFSTMTNGDCDSISPTKIIIKTRHATSNSSASCYIQNSTATVKFKVEGLSSTDILGVGGGEYDSIQNKITEDGTYELSFNGTWGFKMWGTDTSITAPVTITSLSAGESTEKKVTDAMLASANAKGWTIYNEGTIV